MYKQNDRDRERAETGRRTDRHKKKRTERARRGKKLKGYERKNDGYCCKMSESSVYKMEAHRIVELHGVFERHDFGLVVPHDLVGSPLHVQLHRQLTADGCVAAAILRSEFLGELTE